MPNHPHLVSLENALNDTPHPGFPSCQYTAGSEALQGPSVISKTEARSYTQSRREEAVAWAAAQVNGAAVPWPTPGGSGGRNENTCSTAEHQIQGSKSRRGENTPSPLPKRPRPCLAKGDHKHETVEL